MIHDTGGRIFAANKKRIEAALGAPARLLRESIIAEAAYGGGTVVRASIEVDVDGVMHTVISGFEGGDPAVWMPEDLYTFHSKSIGVREI
jgi:hypothetical protein